MVGGWLADLFDVLDLQGIRGLDSYKKYTALPTAKPNFIKDDKVSPELEHTPHDAPSANRKASYS